MTSPHMRRALGLAESVLGSTSPNPSVGCVIARGETVLGEGATQPAGGPHAEVMGLRAAGSDAKDAVVFVTLEPHAHHGRTPPCTDALIEAGVTAVRIAMLDPNPHVSGAGVAALRAAGISVEVGDGEAEARRLLEAYIKHTATGLPFVIVKFAATLDGKIAATSGDSRWVAGAEARAWAHAFRTRVDAIMCGVNNVLLDDPELTARPGGVVAERQPLRVVAERQPLRVVAERQPLRVVADSRGRTPPGSKVLRPGAKTMIATTNASPSGWRESIVSAGGEVCELPADPHGKVDMRALVRLLGERGILSLLVEGGGVLHGSFFDAGLVDKVHAIIAPKIVGGGLYSAVAGQGAPRMADAIALRDVELLRLGPDAVFVGYV